MGPNLHSESNVTSMQPLTTDEDVSIGKGVTSIKSMGAVYVPIMLHLMLKLCGLGEKIVVCWGPKNELHPGTTHSLTPFSGKNISRQGWLVST